MEVVSNCVFNSELMKKKNTSTNIISRKVFDGSVCERMKHKREKRRSVLRLSHSRVKDTELQTQQSTHTHTQSVPSAL